MAIVPLRIYNREIEDLIEQGQQDEAIARCKHILESFPKHIDTYRLLGKAYLESQRYGDAADVLQRVLASIPDDFISHLGMSIIREVEGNLDEAIWHMERAFEGQPANPAVQGELRRLYGRRDGLEPAKVRLTRGALARMYIKGELYPQAISELRAALAEDLQRPDLLALLARAYFLSGMKVDAAETCSNLLEKLPYCLEANRLLAEILEGSERSAEALTYRQRVEALDPYAAHLSPAAKTVDKVPEDAVTIERLDWIPGQRVPGSLFQPEKASSPSVSVEKGTAEEEIPEWMKTAGWEPSSGVDAGSVEDHVNPEGPSQEAKPDEEIAPAEIPEWLRSIAPPQAVEEAKLPAYQEGIEQTSPSDLENLAASGPLPPKDYLPWLAETTPGPTDSVTNWLEDKGPEPVTSNSLTGQAEGGAEAGGITPESEQVSAGDGDSTPEIPGWVQGLEEPGAEPETLANSAEADQAGLPEWLSDSQPETAPGEIPDWLKGLADQTEGVEPEAVEGLPETQPSATDLTPTDVSADTAAEEAQAPAPEWMPDSAGKMEALQEEAPGWMPASPTEGDTLHEAAPEWISEAETTREEAQDWVSEDTAHPEDFEGLAEVTTVGVYQMPDESQIIMEEPASEPAATEIPQGSQELEETQAQEAEQPVVGPAQPKDEEEEEAFAWLEGLAARQGATEDLFAHPEENIETPPEWVAAEAEAQRNFTNEEPVMESLSGDQNAAEVEPGSLPEWLEESPEGQPEAMTSESMEPEEEQEPAETGIPGWLLDVAPDREGAGSPGIPFEAQAGAVVFPFLGDEEEELLEPAVPGEIPEWLSQAAGSSEAASTEAGLTSLDQSFEGEGEKLAGTQPAGLSSLEEPPISEEDTKPTRLSQAMEVPIPLEAAGFVIRSEGEAPSAAEPAADWPVSFGEETTQPTEKVSITDESWETPAGQTEETQAGLASETPAETPPEEQAGAAPVPAEQEEAFSWLESPSAVQGEEEELAGLPEEPHEALPEWLVESETGSAAETQKVQLPEEGVAAVEAEGAPKAELPAEAEAPAEAGAGTAPSEPAQTESDIEGGGIFAAGAAAAVSAGAFMGGRETPEEELQSESTVSETARSEKLPGFTGAQIFPTPTRQVEAAPVVEPAPAPTVEESRVEAEAAAEPPVPEETAAEEIPAAAPPAEEAAPAVVVPDLPDWLAGVDRTQVEETPGWTPPEEAIAEQAMRLDLNEAAPTDESESKLEASPDAIVDENQVRLIQARNALAQGDRDTSLKGYISLIRARTLLPEVISDLHEALYRFPVDLELYQALGDAYARNNQIQDALDAYTKAEELLG